MLLFDCRWFISLSGVPMAALGKDSQLGRAQAARFAGLRSRSVLCLGRRSNPGNEGCW